MFDSLHGPEYLNVQEVLNVHVNENNLKIYFFLKDFFSSSKKLTSERENMIF